MSTTCAGLLAFPKDTGNRNFTDALEGRKGSCRVVNASRCRVCHGTEGSRYRICPKTPRSRSPQSLTLGYARGDRIVEVDDAVVGVDDVDRRIGQAVEDVAGGSVTFCAKGWRSGAAGCTPPMILDMRMRASTSCCVHMRRLPRSEADMADHVPVVHDVHWRSEEMVSSRMNVFSSGGLPKIAAIIDAVGVRVLGSSILSMGTFWNCSLVLHFGSEHHSRC